MVDLQKMEETAAALARKGFVHEFGKPRIESKESPVWKEVQDAGSRLWLDTGDIEEASGLWNRSFEALTVNNTLLNKEVQKGIYDELIPEAAAAINKAVPDIGEKNVLMEIAFILNAFHCLRLVEQLDAYVSVELHTDLANDVEGTVSYGKRFYDICPERFYVKVPLSPAGYLAARKLGNQGVPVNFTLGFSARHNYLAALLSRPRYVNVFLGRLNSFVADNNLGDGENVGEKATLATQRELSMLRDAGSTETLLIAASMREGPQVASLAGADVLTMPTKVAGQYAEKPAHQVSSQVHHDPSVRLVEGVKLDDFNGRTLWEVSDAFKKCVADLLEKDIGGLTPESLQAHFEGQGFGDFLPHWTDVDCETVAADGKIPIYEKWRERLSSGKIGMDALMNISALYSFATDQNALDDRIRRLL
jgi:transaldolase